MKMFYAGIGARDTPPLIIEEIHEIAIMLRRNNWWLRSGGARGADRAFELGAVERCHVYLARQTKDHPEWFDHAAQYHPAWEKCTRYAQVRHARNSAIMLGSDLREPVSFVVCWTPGGKTVGGTGQSLRIAEAYGIPVFNLFDPKADRRLRDFLTSKEW